MEYISTLNIQQQQAVTAGTGPILVLAGPGSGKTRVLTHRIAYLIGFLGVRSFQITAVTFTNKAAREMENRVVELLGQQTRGLTLGTFHSICARILRRESKHLPFDSNYVIFDADDQLRVVKQIIKDLNLDDKRYRPLGVHSSISRAKNELVLADDYPVQTYRDEVVKEIYQQYQQILISSNAVDFDDLLLWTAYLLEGQPAVREKYARRYEHVLVDEFQDTNMAQYTLLKHLTSFHQNIFVVGDSDQSIYRWRGADYRNILRFEDDFPAAQVILLEQNYRSTQYILDTAMSIINQNPHRTPKKLFTDRGKGKKAVIREMYDDREEASFVVDSIAKMVARDALQPGDFAIMYRTNAQSRVMEEAFLTANLPYKLVGAQRFYGRREIRDIIGFLKLVYNPKDEVSLLRVINTPSRGIGDKTIILLRTRAKQLNLSPGELLLDLGKGDQSQYGDDFSKRALTVLAKFGNALSNWVSVCNQENPLKLMDHIIDDIDYRSYIDDGTDEGHDRWENVMELRRLASEYHDKNLESFLEDVTLVSDQDTLDASANVPTLLTLHAAKGLEFPIVFIVGLIDGTLPHIRSFDDPEGMQEERRLLYVGITRAKDQLYLLHTINRYTFGYSEPAQPSRFLADIPDLILDLGLTNGFSGRGSAVVYRPEKWDEPGSKEIVERAFDPGAQVEHSVWGQGLVLSSKIENDDEIVDVFFESVGLKRVIASIAKLEIKT
jgi:DNA helicase-2/ATP-dependent DNA helicase PcrA